MAVLRPKPYPGTNFSVDIGSGDPDSFEAGLAEVIFPEARVQVLDYRNGNEAQSAGHKVRTVTSYGNLILRRGVIGSLNWYEWWNAVRNGDQRAARTIVIHLFNEDRSERALMWKFFRAFPVNHQFSPLNALGSEPFMETLEVAFEYLEME